MREPQCESVKRYSPVIHKERKPMCSSTQQAVRTDRKREVGENPSGSIERGERTKVTHAYLGGLSDSIVNGRIAARFCKLRASRRSDRSRITS